MFNAKWIEMETYTMHEKTFKNYEDKLEFCGLVLFPKILQGLIVRIN